MRVWTKETPLKKETKAVVRAAPNPDRSHWADPSSEAKPTDGPGRAPLIRDYPLLWWSLAATMLGLVFVYDAGYARSIQQGRGPIPREFWTQAVFLLVSLGAAWLAARVSIEVWRRAARPLWFATLAALLGLEFFGHELNGAVRWYKLGPFTFQPAEFAKVAVVLYLAAVLANRKAWPKSIRPPANFALRFDSIWAPKLKRALPALWVAAGIVLIEKEPDLGTGFIVAAIAFAMLWAGGVSRRSLAWCAGLAAIMVVATILISPYRLERFASHSDRWNPANVDGVAYQTVQSELAMASGGLFGVGMGAGRAKHVMPAATTDFVSSTIGEEFGLFGWLAVTGVLFALTWRFLTLALRASADFSRLVLFGIGAWIGGQAVLNLTMANGTLPAIGIPLPFVSSGGSSLVALWIAVGLGQAALAPMKKLTKEAGDAAGGDGRRDGRPRLSRA